MTDTTPQPGRGERLADLAAERLGSWPFILWQSSAIVAWLAWNIWAPFWRIDPPEFVGLNLLLSLQAAYTGPILLISANRQARKDRALWQQMAADTHALMLELHGRAPAEDEARAA